MMDTAQKVQIVINTLGQLTIPSTFDNVNRMAGIYQMLYDIRDGEKKPEEAVTEDG